MSYVIALAAAPGGGKTSVVKGIAQRLNASALHFDHYEEFTLQSIESVIQWMNEGADVNAFSVPHLCEILTALKQGHSIHDPIRRGQLEATKYTILETPFGKEHQQTAEFIDLLIWIDTPLDVALARKIKEFTEIFLSEDDARRHGDRLRWLREYLDNYLRAVHDLLQLQRERVRATADLQLDGCQDVNTLIQQAEEAIIGRLP